jgi:hypothetical protein
MTYTTREWNFDSNVEKEKDDIITPQSHKKQNNDNSRACPTKFSLSSPKRRRFNHSTHHKYKTTPQTKFPTQSFNKIPIPINNRTV